MTDINENIIEKNTYGEYAPYRITTNDTYGLHMVASRNLSAGSVILLEKPLLVGPHPYSSPICLGCNDHIEESEMYRCPRCHWPMCSEECSHSKLHADECPILAKDVDKRWVPKNLEPTPCNGLIMILRCLLFRYTNPDIFITILSMVSNVRNEKRKKVPDDNICDIAEYLEKCGFEYDLVCEVDGVLNSNGINTKSKKGIHRLGIYKFHRIFNHSCVPNVHMTDLRDNVLQIRTTVDIKENQQLYITYLETTVPLWERTIALSTHYCFNCTCPRCVDSTEMGTHYSSGRCPKCPDNFLVPKDDLEELYWKCNSCDYSETIFEVKAKMKELLDETNIWTKPSPEEILSLLNKAEKIFHSLHYIWVKIAEIGLRHIRRQDTIPSHFVQTGIVSKLQELFSVIEPGLTRRRGMAFIEQGCVLLRLATDEYENCEDTILPNALYRAREAIDMFRDGAEILMLEDETSRNAQFGMIAQQKKKVSQKLLEAIRSRAATAPGGYSDLFRSPIKIRMA